MTYSDRTWSPGIQQHTTDRSRHVGHILLHSDNSRYSCVYSLLRTPLCRTLKHDASHVKTAQTVSLNIKKNKKVQFFFQKPIQGQ